MESGNSLATTDPSIVDFDGVCAKLRAACEPVRAQAVSLHDESGDILWLTESSMGPDEHNAVRDAMEAFARPAAPECSVSDLGAGRSAVLLKAVNPSRKLVGAAMLIIDTRHVAGGARDSARFLTPPLREALAAFAAMRTSPPLTLSPPGTLLNEPARAPAAVRKPAAPQPPPASAAQSSPDRPALSRRRSPAPALPHAPADVPVLTAAVVAPAAGLPVTGLARSPVPAVSAELDRLHAALRRTPIALHVQRLLPLAKGSPVKRYEVLLRSGSGGDPNTAPASILKSAVENGLGSMIDRRVLTELIGWLIRHPGAWREDGIMISVNLTRTAMHDEHFMRFVGLCLAKSALPKATIAFEIDVQTALKPSTNVAGIAGALHALGCPLILDDFSMQTECFDLLRLPAVKFIKLAPQVTADMRTDKLAQAQITALVQMARVLGMHTVAKHTASASEQEWLTALGVDFVQSNRVSPPVPIETLAREEAGR